MANALFSIFPNERFVDLNLYQYGWQKCSSLHSYGPFVRNHYLFHYVISGTGTFTYTDSHGNNHTHTINTNQGFLISPKQITTYYADQNDPWEYAWLEFDGLRVKESLELAGLCPDSPIYTCSENAIGDLLKKELLYIVQNSNASPLHLIGHLYLFLDYLTCSSASRQMHTPSKLGDFYVKEALSFIEQNFHTNISIEDIANFCKLNRSYFGKIFRDRVGKSPQEFLIEYRMSKAAQLLKHSGLSINAISHSVGYPNQLHFSRAFKNIYNLSPRQWRTENKIINEFEFFS